MAPRSKIKGLQLSNSIMINSRGKSASNFWAYAFVGVCVACLPIYACASNLEQVAASDNVPLAESDDLLAEESQHIGFPPQRIPLPPPSGLPRLAAVPTSPIPVAVPAPPNAPLSSVLPPPHFSIPKTDLASAPSYAPRYVVPPTNPWDDRLSFEMASFRRRAAQEDDPPAEDDYQPSESKGKKSSPSVFKRIRNGIRNTGKAIVGAPSYIIKRYRKYFGGSGGGKKKKGGWKGWSSSPKQDDGATGGGGGDWGGWEEYEPSGFDREPSHYPSEKGGWKSGKGGYRDYDSHERRYDREPSSYRDYRDRDRDRDRARDDYRDERERHPPRDRHRSSRDRPQKYSQSYREETHYDDYDGRRTTAYYGPDRKSPPERTSERPTERSERPPPPPPPEKKRPYASSTSSSNSGSSYKYDDDY